MTPWNGEHKDHFKACWLVGACSCHTHHTHTRTHAHTHSQTHTHTPRAHTDARTHTTLTHTHTHSLTLTHTHSHTHSLTHTHTHSLRLVLQQRTGSFMWFFKHRDKFIKVCVWRWSNIFLKRTDWSICWLTQARQDKFPPLSIVSVLSESESL